MTLKKKMQKTEATGKRLCHKPATWQKIKEKEYKSTRIKASNAGPAT